MRAACAAVGLLYCGVLLCARPARPWYYCIAAYYCARGLRGRGTIVLLRITVRAACAAVGLLYYFVLLCARLARPWDYCITSYYCARGLRGRGTIVLLRITVRAACAAVGLLYYFVLLCARLARPWDYCITSYYCARGLRGRGTIVLLSINGCAACPCPDSHRGLARGHLGCYRYLIAVELVQNFHLNKHRLQGRTYRARNAFTVAVMYCLCPYSNPGLARGHLGCYPLHHVPYCSRVGPKLPFNPTAGVGSFTHHAHRY